MTDEPLDELIRAALLRRAAGEAAKLRARPIPAPVLSSAYQRWERRFLADPFRRAKQAARPAWLRVTRAAAAILLTVSLSFGALMAVSPTVRAWVQRVAAEWFDEFAAFRFVRGDSQPDGELGAWYPTWLPEGYDLVEEFNPFGNSVALKYQDGMGNSIHINYITPDVGTFNISSEYHSISTVRIHDEDGYLLHATADACGSSLIWLDSSNNVAFLISSTLTDAELLHIAESMSQKE